MKLMYIKNKRGEIWSSWRTLKKRGMEQNKKWPY